MLGCHPNTCGSLYIHTVCHQQKENELKEKDFPPERKKMPSSGGEKSAPPLFVLYEHSSPVLCCEFYPSRWYQREQSSWFLSGDVDGTVVLWNLITRRSLISFSALEEARRQLLDNAQRGRDIGKNDRNAGDADAEPDAALNLNLAALGPHSRSVISVGFIPTTVARAAVRKGVSSTFDEEDLPTNQTSREQSENMAEGSLTCSPSTAASYMPRSSLEGPRRHRLRLTRPTSRTLATADSFPVADVTSEQMLLQQSATSSPSICFYTHCRDQRVYIWSFFLPSAASAGATSPLRLLAALSAPQHGFCPVESVLTVENGSPKTYLAVPHDSQGVITVWELEWKQKREGASYSTNANGRSVLDDSAETNRAVVADDGEKSDDDTEEVDTTGMNPMDALIARATAQERREEKRHNNQRKDVSHEQQDQHKSRLNRVPEAVVSKTERGSFLCFVAPFATMAACNFSIRRLCSFSACPRFKGGTIMRLTACADAQHLAVAFESGHVVLARFRTAPEKNHADQTKIGVDQKRTLESSSGLDHGVTPSVAGVRCSVRAFAESALACWWSGRRVLACSAEGGLHCYEAAPAPQDSVSDIPPCATGGPLRLQLLWSATLRKGIGSVCMQANLVVAGCWDSTLRLYDARDGRLVSILSYQRETVNEVRMAPSVVARVAAFGFDARQPRCYAPSPARLALAEIQDGRCGASSTVDCGHDESGSIISMACVDHDQNTFIQGQEDREENLVYLFASASKDGTVALWRVDMQLVAEKAALKIISA